MRLVRGEVSGTPQQAAFATRLGVSTNTLGRYERGETAPPGDFLVRLCEDFHVSGAWLLTGEGPMLTTPDGILHWWDDSGHAVLCVEKTPVAFRVAPTLAGESVAQLVPVYDIVSATRVEQLQGTEFVLTYTLLCRTFLADMLYVRPDAVFGVSVHQDYMEPTLHHGATALLDGAVREVEGDGVYLVERADGLQLRHVLPQPDGGVVIRCDNPKYGKEDVLGPHAAADLRIGGRVVGHISRL